MNYFNTTTRGHIYLVLITENKYKKLKTKNSLKIGVILQVYEQQKTLTSNVALKENNIYK